MTINNRKFHQLLSSPHRYYQNNTINLRSHLRDRGVGNSRPDSWGKQISPWEHSSAKRLPSQQHKRSSELNNVLWQRPWNRLSKTLRSKIDHYSEESRMSQNYSWQILLWSKKNQPRFHQKQLRRFPCKFRRSYRKISQSIKGECPKLTTP